jgi:LPS-assembly protein
VTLRQALLIVLAPLLSATLPSVAQAEEAKPAPSTSAGPRLTADHTRLNEQETTFTGNARLTQEGVILTADEIVYRPREKIAIARGNVVLVRGPQRLVADEITFDTTSRTFAVGRFRVGQAGVLAEAVSADGSADDLRVQTATVTYGEPESLSPALRSNEVRYTAASSAGPYSGAQPTPASVSARDNRLVVAGLPVAIPAPALNQTLGQPPTIDGLSVEAGYSGNLGVELELEATVPVGAERDAAVGADLGLYSKRGAMIGPVARYDTVGADGLGAYGRLRSGYIKDQGDTDLDVLGDPVRDDRGFVDWTHHQRLTPDLRLDGQLHYWSDSEVVRDFSPESYRSVQTPDTWLEAQYRQDNYIVSAFARARPNNYDLVQQRLPEIRLDALPVELGAGIYHRLSGSVAALREKSPDDSFLNSTNSTRADLYYSATRPFSPREWLSFNPVVGGRLTHYQHTIDESGSYTRGLAEVGFDSELRTSATWNYQNPKWRINGLRHLLTPKVSYRYAPSADAGQRQIPVIDDITPFETYLPPLGLGDQRNVDRLRALNTFRLGLDNTLQTRDANFGSRDLARLDFAFDYRLEPDEFALGARHSSDVHTFLALSPARWLRFDAYHRFSTDNSDTQEFNTGLTLTDADIWSLRFGNHYLGDAPTADGRFNELTADIRYRLNELYTLVGRWRYDHQETLFSEQIYGLEQRLNRLWVVTYALSLYDGPRREDDVAFTVRLDAEPF